MDYREVLKDIEPERLEIIDRCIGKIQGKSDKEIIAVITEAAKEFNLSGRPITAAEQKVLIGTMRDNLQPEQKKKFDIIINMMGIKN
jgi:hypothetical protein